MQLGMIGLGRMGANMVRRLLKGEHQCVVYNRSAKAVAELVKENAVGTTSLARFAKILTKPRAVWLMVPTAVVDNVVAELLPHLVARAAEEGAIARFDLGTLRARRWSTLSGGERARVLLAMVLAVDPPALLADEPAASLDIRHRIDVVQALVARATDRLSVVVMHDLDLTFRFFDNVIVMDAGRIVAHGRAQDIFDDQRLDAAFGVRFERLVTTRDRLLRPM